MIYKVCHCYCMIAFFSKKLSSSFHTINGLRYGTVTGSGLERSYSNSKDSVTPWQGSGRLLVGKSLYPLVSSYPRITSTSHLGLWKYWTYWHDCCWSGNRDLNTSDMNFPAIQMCYSIKLPLNRGNRYVKTRGWCPDARLPCLTWKERWKKNAYFLKMVLTSKSYLCRLPETVCLEDKIWIAATPKAVVVAMARLSWKWTVGSQH